MTEDMRFVNDMMAWSRGRDIPERDRKSIEELIHRLFLKERRHRKLSEERETELPYVVLNQATDADEGDHWEKRLYPGEDWNADEIREFIRDEWVHVTSPYDCSGQRFTTRMDVFHRPEGMLVYVFSAIDC